MITKGILLDEAKQDMDFILTSTNHLITDPATRDRLVDSIITSLNKRTISDIKETTHYKLATILKCSDMTFGEFKRKVVNLIPQYKNNPRKLLDLGGLSWTYNFEIPPIRKYVSKRKKALDTQEKFAPTPTPTLDTMLRAIVKEEVSTVLRRFGFSLPDAHAVTTSE